jgi:hypothetical protein
VRSNGKHIVNFSAPRRLETHEVPLVINDFKVAAINAVEAGKCLSTILSIVNVKEQEYEILSMDKPLESFNMVQRSK